MHQRIIESRPALVIRLIGIAIMLGGANFLRKYFFTDLIASIKDPDFLPGGLIGLLFILVIGLAITGGGALMAFLRKRTVVDTMLRTVTSERGMLGFKQTESWPFSDFTRVLNLCHSEQNQTGSTNLYNVELLRHNGGTVHIEVFTQSAKADELTKTLANMLQIPITDGSRDEWMARDDETA
jgi:hypothetical protein